MRFHNEEDQDSIDIITPYSVFSLILLLFRFLKPIKIWHFWFGMYFNELKYFEYFEILYWKQ